MTGFAFSRWVTVSSTFSPNDIAGMIAWFSADSNLFQDSGATTPATANNDPVGYWGDLSSNVRNATQTTSSKRPTLITSSINSRPAIRFDGTDDFLNYTTAFTAVSGRTIYAVARWNNIATAANMYFFDGWTAANRSAIGTSGVTNYLMFAGTNYITGTLNTSAHINVAIFNGATSQRYIDNVAAATGDAGTNTMIDFVLGSGRQGTSFFAPFDVAEVIAYSGVHNTTQINSMLAYLRARYATY